MVTVNKKQLAGNKERIFLDFYPPILHPETGKPTRREFLDLFLYSEIENEVQKYLDSNGKEQKKYVPVLDKKLQPKKAKLTVLEKIHNEETSKLAENIRATRQLEIQAGNYGFLKSTKKQFDFLSFLKAEAENRKAENRGDKNNWMSLYRHLMNFSNGICTNETLTEQFCKDFKEYIKTTPPLIRTRKKLANNSTVHYFVIFKSAVKKAYEQNFLSTNPTERVNGIKKTDTQREYLTYNELQNLAKTDCPYPELKKAALLSALTGLRYSDIEKLIWGEVFEDIETKNGIKSMIYFIRFTQQKTKGTETLPISKQAFELMGNRGEDNEKVFKDIHYSAWQNYLILDWIRKAGINKHITFHNFRHTYATLQLTLGTDIYTVSKMLGHRELKTTQIYAKIVDDTKRKAADKIKLDM